MGGILGSTGANKTGGTGTGGAASGLLGSLAGAGSALSALNPITSLAGSAFGVLTNHKKQKAAEKEAAREQGILDQNYDANVGFQKSLTDPNSQAGQLFSQMIGPQTTTQSGQSATSGSSSSDSMSGLEFGAKAPEAQAQYDAAKNRVAQAGTLASDAIKAGVQSQAADTALRRTALGNRAAKLGGGYSAADLALGDPMSALGNRAQSQLVADSMRKKYEDEGAAQNTIQQLLTNWFGKQHQVQKQKYASNTASSGSMTGPGNAAAGLQALSPVQRELLKQGQA